MPLSYTLAEMLNIPYKEVEKIYKNLPIKSLKDLKINYQKLNKLGYKDSEINDIIKYIEKQILKNKLKNNYKSIKTFLTMGGGNNERN